MPGQGCTDMQHIHIFSGEVTSTGLHSPGHAGSAGKGRTSWLFLTSCGWLHILEYFCRMASISVLEYWNSLELELNMTRAMSQPHSTLSSMAFFISPFLRFVNVTYTAQGHC